ncbi:hypothetical protein H4R18_002434 [Coemansia javaensis]|uniref:EamA domain-containing protein n=1 Tax=Coemansia javaensis TaxID=2761396 RepID=A0A9W8LJ54_9FUNG|nr:hypothetical protein H4R18_002434 [Coemansia javaensis]
MPASFSRQAALLAAGMLATGTANTLLTKLQDKQCVANCDDPDPANRRLFEQPVWQTLNMFYGEMLCLACLYLARLCAPPAAATDAAAAGDAAAAAAPPGYEPIADEDDEDDDDGVPELRGDNASPSPTPALKPIAGCATLWMWVPAACDLLGTTLMNVGLFFTSASVYQMLRGAVVIFSGIFSVLFLGHRLDRSQVASLGMVVVGVTIVGLSNVISPPVAVYAQWRAGESADPTALKAALGVVLVLGAQIFTATQFVVEEKILRRYHLTPLRAVGLEGSFGAATVMAAIPVLHFAFGRADPGGYFDAPAGFRQIVENPSVWQTSIYIMVSIALFNYFGLSVTRYLSATSRATIDTCRTLFIWMSSLALGWEAFSWVQVLGFAILVYGTFVYNRVIAAPF